MVYIGLLLLCGGLVTALLFGMDYDKELPRFITRVFLGVALVGLILCALGPYNTSCLPVYRYQIKAHYVNGDEKIFEIESTEDPYIDVRRGAYYLECGDETIIGVVTFEVISKNKISDNNLR